MRVAMIGTGYVGLVSGTCFSEFGVNVICVDKDAGKIDRLRQGIIPIFEPGLEELVKNNVEGGRLTFTTNLKEAVAGVDAVFIAVGTPTRKDDGHADLTYVHNGAKEIALAMDHYTVVVTKSTVPVGTGREVENIIRKARPEAEFDVVSNPEFFARRVSDKRLYAARPRCDWDRVRPRPRSHAETLSRAVSHRNTHPVHQPRNIRTHQVCGQRIFGHEDHVHQRSRRFV